MSLRPQLRLPPQMEDYPRVSRGLSGMLEERRGFLHDIVPIKGNKSNQNHYSSNITIDEKNQAIERLCKQWAHAPKHLVRKLKAWNLSDKEIEEVMSKK